MKNASRVVRAIGTTCVVGAILWPVTGCSSQDVGISAEQRRQVTLDAVPVVYGSLDQMIDDAQLIVLANLRDPAPTTLGQLSKPRTNNEDSLPMLVWRADVQSVLKGTAPDDLRVARFDLHDSDVQLVTDGLAGDTTADVPVVLFLDKGNYGTYYALGIDQGFVDIAPDGVLRWRTGDMPVKSPRRQRPDRAPLPVAPPKHVPPPASEVVRTLPMLERQIERVNRR